METKKYKNIKNSIYQLSSSLIIILLSTTISFPVNAQLMECAQIDEGGNIAASAVGACISKTLAEQIGTGHGDENTFGSSTYIIKRDPARSVRRGRQLFQRKFSAEEGQGPRVNATSTGDITHSRALGAGLSSQAIQAAADTGTNTTRALVAKGINFGSITAGPNGDVDTSQVEGVNEDLRILPFFHQGGTASIREFIIGALNDEMGLQSVDSVLCAVTDSDNPGRRVSPAGFVYEPDLDTFGRPPACDVNDDPDGDNVANEIDTALVDHMEFYLLNYFKPGQYSVSSNARRGRKLMDDVGCTSCHTADLTIEKDRRIADVETTYNPNKGIFNQLFATATPLTTDVADGDTYPLAKPNEAPFVVKNIFSDLKRHDLGPKFHERDWDGTVVTKFVTEPLWGVGTTAPYGHDGRSINLDSVIRRHGGEAQSSTDNYAALSAPNRMAILEFLQTLVLFPPDDTASNLNPGNPGTTDPQNPAEHGSINLGELFRINSEGAE